MSALLWLFCIQLSCIKIQTRYKSTAEAYGTTKRSKDLAETLVLYCTVSDGVSEHTQKIIRKVNGTWDRKLDAKYHGMSSETLVLHCTVSDGVSEHTKKNYSEGKRNLRPEVAVSNVDLGPK
jgi:hypothetical protein